MNLDIKQSSADGRSLALAIAQRFASHIDCEVIWQLCYAPDYPNVSLKKGATILGIRKAAIYSFPQKLDWFDNLAIKLRAFLLRTKINLYIK